MSSPRVLVVDDNAINLQLVSYLLQSAGCEVCAVDNGEQALAALEAPGDPFDVVLCDIQMPVMDGYEFARRVKSDARRRELPMVALTALAMVGDRERVMQSGFDAYLSKPIEPATFIETLRAVVPGLFAPSVDAAAAAPPPAPGSTPPRTTGQTILVVDDTVSNLELKQGMLQPLGFRVLTASTPDQALALARHERPDLIISDIGLGEGTGFDVIARVKAEPHLRDVPFVFLTATHWDEESQTRALAMGADRYLTRPIDTPVLIEEIRRLLARAPR
ncbi:response regulator [Ideonella sp.]|uniref:response regulator n=1 Tax=Ideonella sp. TaxID=1929293 RepID=UPI0035B26EEF